MTSPTSHRARFLTGVGAAAMALTVAACGSSSTAAGPSAPATTAAPAPVPGDTLTATLSDFHIALSSRSVPAGTYTIKVSNAGNTLHALDVAGPGGTVAASPSVLPGQSTTVSVTLPAGSYHLYCPIANHRAMGMDVVLTVQGGGGGSTVTTVAGSSY
ncbi:hypothetical protein K6U06_23355 [Acidiferrimicrobium sp. IK]|uniref:hypothetical protein n=1 Tax=Acidiferrimicrobium sp. IK TaxID=2871700 RepID=UPI0021CB8A1C|nr:hypothetical protein [Acidiferrimicrobium sp. IK]MCU4187320.1 hypothetical protein [Acidiferrimicrobium sp. IK]